MLSLYTHFPRLNTTPLFFYLENVFILQGSRLRCFYLINFLLNSQDLSQERTAVTAGYPKTPGFLLPLVPRTDKEHLRDHYNVDEVEANLTTKNRGNPDVSTTTVVHLVDKYTSQVLSLLSMLSTHWALTRCGMGKGD